MTEQLAINGGPKAVPDGTIQPWPPIDDVDHDMVLAALEGEKHAVGPNCEAFQKEFAEWNGNRFGFTTNSGTSALHMGVAACGCGIGDEVIVPAYSWAASATSIIHNQAIPVFVDIDFDTMNIDVNRIEAAITPKTKAILVVHLHGLSVEMDTVMDVAARHGLDVIEDGCQGHAATYKGKRTGTWGSCAAFSCNHNKLLCGGTGGVFVTDDEELLKRAMAVGSFGETRDPVDDPDYHAYAKGWMYYNNELSAAFARAQLTKLDGYLERIRQNAAVFAEGLDGVPHIILPTVPEGCEHNWYNYTLRFDMEALGHADAPRAFRDKIVAALNAEGVPFGVWQQFILPDMTVFRAQNAFGKGYPWASPHSAPVDYARERFPVAQRHCESHACLVMALRPPHGPEVAELLAKGVRKVMANIDQLEE